MFVRLMPPVGRSLALLGMFALTGALGFAGCAPSCEDCEEAATLPPTGTPAAENFLIDHPHQWAMVRQILQEVLVYGEGPMDDEWYEQNTWSYILVNWEDDENGNLIRQTEKVCSVATSVIEIQLPVSTKLQETKVPDALVSHVPDDTWDASLSKTTGTDGQELIEFQLTPPQYSVWGTDIDALTGQCPMDATESGWFDTDEDGNPGATTEVWINGEWYADTYVCQRLVFSQLAGAAAEADGGYKIQGYINEVTVDQSQYGVDGDKYGLLDGKDPEVRWDEANQHITDSTFYIMLSLPEGTVATCDDVKPSMF